MYACIYYVRVLNVVCEMCDLPRRDRLASDYGLHKICAIGAESAECIQSCLAGAHIDVDT